MGAIKQMHIDCEPGNCVAPAAYIDTCYMQPDGDIQPTEPPVSTDGSDRDDALDMEQE